MVSISGMTVSIKTDLWFPITGQQGHGSRNIHEGCGKTAIDSRLGTIEYSCAVKPHIRAGGNRQSGIQETVIASLLA